MDRSLYLECYSGISGDMFVAALLDLGAKTEILDSVLKSIKIQTFTHKITRVKKSGLAMCDFQVILHDRHNPDHDMEYLHGEAHEKEKAHSHDSSPKEHHHRGLAEIIKIIEETTLGERGKKLAIRIFQIIAQAEARVHGVAEEEVHFHEVGAVDSIVDIVAAACCLEQLDFPSVIVPELYDGTGYIRCQHGQIPVPVPAVTQIVMEHGIHLHLTNIQGELVTPTGAAIVAAIQTSSHLPDHFTIQKMGMGAGKRNYERPSILRAMEIREENGK